MGQLGTMFNFQFVV